MPNTKIESPDWLREMETILDELNEGVVVVDGLRLRSPVILHL